jgi:hypothetical protein
LLAVDDLTTSKLTGYTKSASLYSSCFGHLPDRFTAIRSADGAE